MTRLCIECGVPLVQRATESAPRFAERKTCSRACTVKLATARESDQRIRLDAFTPDPPRDAGREEHLYAGRTYTDDPRALRPEPRFIPPSIDWSQGGRTL